MPFVDVCAFDRLLDFERGKDEGACVCVYVCVCVCEGCGYNGA
jgi:hypothetical protein